MRRGKGTGVGGCEFLLPIKHGDGNAEMRLPESRSSKWKLCPPKHHNWQPLGKRSLSAYDWKINSSISSECKNSLFPHPPLFTCPITNADICAAGYLHFCESLRRNNFRENKV
ncbi:hypothetical protein CEXT_731181 [Caerostris extrusa]|uniref:Uncharacterized protein n=1 Tax=Caerostris extrusa TaxID=172846 RepID=A0AAV4VWL2_CAEEX|nr:hypothetical protein CEXT_731181 [Caerostris extrusa]